MPSGCFRPRLSKGTGLLILGLLLVLSLGVTGCSSLSLLQPMDADQLERVLRSRGVDPRRVVVPYSLTPEMMQWAKETAPVKLARSERLSKLRNRLLDQDEMAVQYVWGYTGTAAEVFHQRQANCLAFTNLFLGMARSVGVPAYFIAVENLESYRKEGDLVVVSDHIAVGYGEATNQQIFDFSETPEDDVRFLKRLSDLTALAMFHSNRGAEAIQRDDIENALLWLETAVEVDPQLATARVNLGVAQRRAGEVEAAEESYKLALELDPGTFSAYHNLASMLRVHGRGEEAEAYEDALSKAPNHNPYTYLSLGDISLRGGRIKDAERFYRRAVSLSRRGNAECYAALGQLAVAQGDLKLARKMLRRARKKGGSSERLGVLAEALASDP